MKVPLPVKQRNRRPRRTLVYGVSGIGKTTFAACSPRAYVLNLEDGCNDIDVNSSPLITNWVQFVELLQELAFGEHDYLTVVLDTLDWLEKIIWQNCIDTYNRSAEKKAVTIEDLGSFGKCYLVPNSRWKAVLGLLDVIRERGCQVFIVAHSSVQKFTPADGDAHDRYTPAIHKIAANKITEWCDEVLFMKGVLHTVKEDLGFQRQRTRAIDAGRRLLITSDQATCIAKTRLPLPREMDAVYSAYHEIAKDFLPPEFDEAYRNQGGTVPAVEYQPPENQDVSQGSEFVVPGVDEPAGDIGGVVVDGSSKRS